MPHGKGVFHAGVQGGGLGINEVSFSFFPFFELLSISAARTTERSDEDPLPPSFQPPLVIQLRNHLYQTTNPPPIPTNKQLMPGDRYEGELHLGFASGLGMLSRQDGRVYRGEFLLGRKHGCGAETDLSPFYEELEKGTDPEEAWERTKAKVAAATRRGTFRGDEFDSGPVEDSDDDDGGHRKSRRKNKKKNKGKVTALDDFDGDDADLRPSDREHRFCTLAEVEGTVEEVEHIVARAKMFEHKPDGAVSTSFTHDDNGTPAPLMQDPLHYPFGTKWMAPGPLGQCFRLPDDEQVLENLDAAAHNHELIWREFNLPRVIEPGTDMAEAVRHSQKVASVRLRDVEPAEMRRAAVELVREVREKAEAVAAAEREAEEDAAGGKPGGSRRPRRRERISDDDLVADAAGLSVSVSGSGSGKGNGGNGGSVFASASASLFGGNNDPAALFASALGRAAEAVASRVPPLGGRRGLARPSRRE